MTEEQRPGRACQPWTYREYELLARLRYTHEWTVGQLAGALCRLPGEIENALIKLKGLNEAMTNRAQAQAHVNAVHKPKTPILSKEDLYRALRKARRLIINGKDYDTILHRVKQRIRLQIEISATLAGGK